jgi:N-acetylmuramoyl-L-alanine amidase
VTFSSRPYRAWLAALLLCLAASFMAPSVQAQDAKAVYDQARADYRWLMKHQRAQGVYQNWQSLADRFTRVYTSHPRGNLAPGALLWIGRIHADAWRRFKRENDFFQAVDVFKRLTNHFPGSRLADDAQLMLAGLYEEAGEPKLAYLEYLKLTVNYPRGDMVPKAKRRLDQLEGELASQQRSSGQAKKKRPAQKTTTATHTAGEALAMVTGLRHWSTPTYTRVVISLEDPVPYKSALLRKDPNHKKPRRLYLDLKGARLPTGFKNTVPIGDGLLQSARAGQYSPDTVRLVLDIKRLASYKVFTLDNPFRVVIDCFGQKTSVRAAAKKSRRARKVPRGRASKQPPEVGLAAALGLGIKRVVIDPGHGGKDNGAMYRGLKEKNITLDISKRVAVKLRKLLGCEVLLTRNHDVYLALEERTAFANTKDADIFVSIHVNAAASHRLKGVETYFLNLASDEESMRVAARENATTTRSISDLQVILNDLMLNSKINESNRLARQVHKNTLHRAGQNNRVRDLKVKQAPFYVLIGAQMPSVLVEVGFLTNPGEHRLLSKSSYRNALARGIAEGIVSYAKRLKEAGGRQAGLSRPGS